MKDTFLLKSSEVRTEMTESSDILYTVVNKVLNHQNIQLVLIMY